MSRDRRALVRRAVVLTVLLGAPLVLSGFRLSLVTSAIVFGLFAASLDLQVGYAGMVSLGHAAFFGLAGYTTALLARGVTTDLLVLLTAAVVASTAGAAVIGYLVRRANGVAFIMLTLAFGQLVYIVATTWASVTGGESGVSGVPRPTLLGLELTGERTTYYVVAVVAIAAYALLRALTTSPFGHAISGLRENQPRMTSLGYRTRELRTEVFAISGGFAGVAGYLYVHHVRFVSPEMAGFELSALALVMVIVGGRRTLYGPAIGAAFVVLLRDELSSAFESWELLLGVLFLLTVYLAPLGLAGLFHRSSEAVGARG